MNEAGIKEVKIKQNNLEENFANKIIGVTELLGLINMDTSYSDAVEKATQRTRNYAKRQLTWLRTYFSNNNVYLTADYTQIKIQQLCKTLPCLF